MSALHLLTVLGADRAAAQRKEEKEGRNHARNTEESDEVDDIYGPN